MKIRESISDIFLEDRNGISVSFDIKCYANKDFGFAFFDKYYNNLGLDFLKKNGKSDIEELEKYYFDTKFIDKKEINGYFEYYKMFRLTADDGDEKYLIFWNTNGDFKSWEIK
jgi:hypothetical protein